MLSRLLTTKEQAVLLAVAAAVCIGGVAFYLGHERAAEVSTQSAEIAPEREIIIHRVEQPIDELLEPAPASGPSGPVSSPPKRITVSVRGAVHAPGVFEFDEGARVEAAVRKAGGLLPEADTSDINMAAALIDGTTLTISAIPDEREHGKRLVLRGETKAPINPSQYTISGWRPETTHGELRAGASGAMSISSGATGRGGAIDLNTATQQELETLPGIGPKLAEAIIAYREQQRFASVEDLQNVRGIGAKRLADIRPLVTVGTR